MHRQSTLIAILALSLAAAANAGPVKKVHKTLPLDMNGRVSVDTHNGAVTILTWNQPTVDVDARIESRDSDYPEDVEKTNVKVTGGGREVRIASDYSEVGEHAVWWFIGTERTRPPIYYTIRIPATASLDVDGHNASIQISDVRNDVVVRSHNGAVDIRALQGGADVETHNGSVKIGFARYMKASTIETHNGSAEVTMPRAAQFTLDVDGHRHDPVSSDFAMVRGRIRGDDDAYSATVNGGGPTLRFSTHNGSLRLGKM